MGQIILSADELVCTLSANALIPDHVTDIEVEGDELRLKVATPLPILTSIHVRVRFAGFECGQVVLQLVTNRLLDTFDWLVDKMLVSLRIEEHGGRWEYPKLYVDVNRLLQQQVRGVQIADVVFKDDRFHITTTHSAETAGGSPDTPRDAAVSDEETPPA
jgi:hypothetical protein